MTREELLTQAKPILFNTEMVKAILEGRKTVTRRVVKPQPDAKHNHLLGYVTDSTDKKDIGKFGFGIDEYGGSVQYAKPPYAAGDYLYVRETWSEVETVNGVPFYIYKADHSVIYADSNHGFKKWHPSIHMPKEAARIFLKVTDVRVERLQDITEEQARKEGCPHGPLFEGDTSEIQALSKFPRLWNSTIKKQDLDKYGWDANPYVFVIEFERVEV